MLNYNGMGPEELKDNHENLQEMIEILQAEVDHPFVEKMAEEYEERGSLTERQVEGLLKFYANLVKE